jgi:hypothetical protein
MDGYIDARERFRRAKTVTTPNHKFDVGHHVTYKAGPNAERGLFRITRHLPDGGQGLQYRIRSDRDGHERVVAESALERAT